MADKKTSVFGIYPSSQQAESAAASLVQAGFRSDDISVLVRTAKAAASSAPRRRPRRPKARRPVPPTGGVARRHARPGSPASARLAIPGLGPFIAAGPIVGAARRRRGAGGAVGGLAGALVGMGIPEYEAKQLRGAASARAASCISVHTATSDRVKIAEQILERTGAEDISSSGEASADTPAATRTATRY